MKEVFDTSSSSSSSSSLAMEERSRRARAQLQARLARSHGRPFDGAQQQKKQRRVGVLQPRAARRAPALSPPPPRSPQARARPPTTLKAFTFRTASPAQPGRRPSRTTTKVVGEQPPPAQDELQNYSKVQRTMVLLVRL